ncbi:zinc finger CCCH domain-containing protein 14-like isoform X2 [Gordionus sp. m RMFG-2023]|uniref:zinc finger CCCH domain-containing protein 14-like isoform X2 n=1 Tax=Gordionus sp. m RMFG-2023 TaxID=3053472 RepID=UPI0031FBB5BB
MEKDNFLPKIRKLIKSKLTDLDVYVDEELIDYITVLLINKKNAKQMIEDLNLFLNEHSETFVKWLFKTCENLQSLNHDEKKHEKHKESRSQKYKEKREDNEKLKKNETIMHSRKTQHSTAHKRKSDVDSSYDRMKNNYNHQEPFLENKHNSNESSYSYKKRSHISPELAIKASDNKNYDLDLSKRQRINSTLPLKDEIVDYVKPVSGEVIYSIVSDSIEIRANETPIDNNPYSSLNSLKNNHDKNPLPSNNSITINVKSNENMQTVETFKHNYDKGSTVINQKSSNMVDKTDNSNDQNMSLSDYTEFSSPNLIQSAVVKIDNATKRQNRPSQELFLKALQGTDLRCKLRKDYEGNQNTHRGQIPLTLDEVKQRRYVRSNSREKLENIKPISPKKHHDLYRTSKDEPINTSTNFNRTIIKIPEERTEFIVTLNEAPSFLVTKNIKKAGDTNGLVRKFIRPFSKMNDPGEIIDNALNIIDRTVLSGNRLGNDSILLDAKEKGNVFGRLGTIEEIEYLHSIEPSQDNTKMEDDTEEGLLNERCKFWPLCKNGEQCSYKHPTLPCKNFPDCTFGDKCLYIHPNCKFDAHCTKKDCPYTHASIRKELFHPNNKSQYPTVYSKSLTGLPLSTNKVPVPNSASPPVLRPISTIPCKFGVGCFNSQCLFMHPPARISSSVSFANRGVLIPIFGSRFDSDNLILYL